MRVCIDVDAGCWLAGGRVRIGSSARRSHTPEQAAELAERDRRRAERCALVGMMAYEAQIAGLGDAPPGAPLRARVIARMQAPPRASSRERRAAVVAAVVAGRPPLELVNGGGTGSLERTPPSPR